MSVSWAWLAKEMGDQAQEEVSALTVQALPGCSDLLPGNQPGVQVMALQWVA